MPDIGWMELMVIGIVALIIVGPEDLPGMFRKLGQMTGRVRAMAKDFTNAMNEAADGTGMTELSRDLRKVTKFSNPKNMAKDFMGDVMEDIDPSKYEEGSATRVIAEKKAAAQAETRKRVAAKRAEREAEESAEPEDPPGEENTIAATDPATSPSAGSGSTDLAPSDPGPANIEA
ncbi:MAG TPA: twin-arginine translocase subunit TatB, partial [Roseibacterium sp.]|nr:twin-arginine translocase subunit TatB [Roseibacterium sp.]